jgi:hypothetical protein
VKVKKARISFENVLATDGVAWTLFGMAQEEGLLYTSSGERFEGRRPSAKARQSVLSLLLLFDKLIVHDFTRGSGRFRLPDLERDDIVEMAAAFGSSTKPQPLKSQWKPSRTDPRKALSVSRRRELALVQAYKPLIIDRLLSGSRDIFEFHDYLARSLGISRRAYYNEFLDLATNYALGNRAALQNNIIDQSLPRDFGTEIKKELFDFEKRGEVLSPTNAVLLLALIFGYELGAIQELSAFKGLGVATRYYTGRAGGIKQSSEAFSVDPSRVPKSFGLVRTVLHEEGHFFPQIQSIAHALKLRKDPHLQAFKEQFREFHLQLERGDREDLRRIRKEVQRAKKALERTAKWTLPLRWLTYISLPAALAEGLLVGTPIAGTSLAVMSAVGTAVSARAYRKNEWALFGM